MLALAQSREEAWDLASAEALYQQAVDAGAGDIYALIHLATLRERAGDRAGVEALAYRMAEADDPRRPN